MGLSGSKEEEVPEEDKYVYDPSLMNWDENGNLILGKAHPVRPTKQIREILKLDQVDEEEGSVWYIVDSAWIASWLAYVHFCKGLVPAPGPCNNRRLISWDYPQSKYVGRFGLFMATKEKAGDYRRVSEACWKKFQEYYPGSGPSIRMEYSASHMKAGGLYDTSTWEILDPPPPPEDKNSKFKKKKKVKRESTVEAERALLGEGYDEEKEDSPEEEKSGGNDISTLMKTQNKPKVALGGSAYQKVPAPEYDSENRPADSDDDSDEETPSLAQNSNATGSKMKRESFFDDVYFGKD